MDAGPSEGWAGWTAAGRSGHGGCEEKKDGESRWRRVWSGWVVAGSGGFRGGDAGLIAGFRVDSHEIRGLCFLYAR